MQGWGVLRDRNGEVESKELVCLAKLQSGETCYNRLFFVIRTNNGLIAVCRQCNAEHRINGDR